MSDIKKLCLEHKDEMIEFLQKIVSIKSITGDEEEVAKAVKEKMEQLGYDKILTSSLGDIIGVLGDGEKGVLFDSHMDTVEVPDESEWKFPPFSGHIEDGRIYGRGTSDMKGSIVSTIYGGFFAKKLGLLEGKTVYVSTSVMEEDFDSYAVGKFIDEFDLKLDFAVICEPSNQKIALGHRGRAMIVVDTFGISAHGSAPENGKNAVYEMGKIIKRVEELNDKFYQSKSEHGSIVLSKIECETASLNAVPAKATIYLDRRLALGENEELIKKEMDELLKGVDASWRIDVAKTKSYTKADVNMKTFFEAWESKEDSILAKALGKAYEEQMGKEPVYFKWPFATNGFATTARGIPTIGFGAGVIKTCHMRDEYSNIDEIINASGIYTNVIKNL